MLGGRAKDIDTKAANEYQALYNIRKNPITQISDVVYGVCRHKSQLFKYLCDFMGIPCRMVLGKVAGKDGREYNHMWNIVIVSDTFYFIDPHNCPEELIHHENVKDRMSITRVNGTLHSLGANSVVMSMVTIAQNIIERSDEDSSEKKSSGLN